MLIFVVSALLGLGCATDSGCGAPCEGWEDEPEDPGVPPYTYVDPEAEWTTDEVGEQIFEVFGLGFPNGELLRTTYLGMMAEGDRACPASDTIITQDFILGCTAESDYYYSGVCQYDVDEFTDSTGTTLAWGLGGDFELAYPSGDRFAAGGGATYTGRRSVEGAESFDTTVRGTWFDESSNNWLGAGFSGLFAAQGGDEAGTRWIEIHGGVAVGDSDLFLDHLTWEWGDTCSGTPVGELRLRDHRGYWYVWTLDDCDPCGDVVFHGDTELGELCLDLTAVGEDAYYSMAVP